MSRLKIAYIVTSLSNKGPIRVVQELIRQLRHDHDITLFYFTENTELSFDVPTYRIPFFTAIDFNAFDIVHTHGIRPDAYVFLHHSKIKRAKTLTTLHNYVKENLRFQYNALISFVFGRLWNLFTIRHDQIVVLSKHAKRYYQDFWYNRRIDVVYNGIDTTVDTSPSDPSRIETVKAFQSDRTLLGAIGLLTTGKGFDQIIKALPYLPDHALIVIGSGQEEQNLKRMTEKLGISHRVLFAGFVPDTAAVLECIDIVVTPSRSEGFSLVVQEAARQHKPVVCSSIPMFRELFPNREIAFFELENIRSLCDAITDATDQKEAFAQKIYHKFTQCYTGEIMAGNYLKIYNALTKERP